MCPVVINNEAWSTSSLDVDLYVHGGDWPASLMRFRNEGGSWTDWEPFSAHKAWTLSCSPESPATVYARIRRGGVVLENSDEIVVDMPLSAGPRILVFLSDQGSSPAIPESYQLDISCCDQWTASANQGWITVLNTSGTGPSSEATVSVNGYPTDPGTYLGTVTVETLTSPEQVALPVILAVTDGPLERSRVPLVAK